MWNDTEMALRLQGHSNAIKLVASDLDGTLYYAAPTITKRTIRALDMIRAKGVGFTICTGRSFFELGDLPRRLGLTEPVICRNGAEIVDPISEKKLAQWPISTAESAAFLRWCLQEGVDICLTTEDTSFFPKNSAFTRFFGPEQKVRPLDGATPLETLTHYKLILLIDQSKYVRARECLTRFPGIRVTAASSEIEDLISSEADKGTGLRWVAEHLGLGRENCCAFGDFVNDIPMFRYAGLSFAMENAAPDVQAAADFVAPPNTADGVARVLETLFG